MGSRIRCFMIEPVQPPQAHYYLRRYRSRSEEDAKCPCNYGYHNAKFQIEDGPVKQIAGGKDRCYIANGIPEPARDDPRWPKICECGYVFLESDEWQLFQKELYRRVDNGEIVTLEDAPAGAMWNAWWMTSDRDYKGPGSYVGSDGLCLSVKTPGGDWLVDGPANNGAGWTRSGTVPDVTANPSIMIGSRYHGFLRAGWLEEC